jgi:DNA repair photolyase
MPKQLPDAPLTPAAPRGRGAPGNPPNRFEAYQRSPQDDGWDGLATDDPAPTTSLLPDASRSLIGYNRSPDVPFDRSVNPYRGCEHGCVYCFARPSHAYLGYSPGLDFESRILFKPDAAHLLRAELSKPGYRCRPMALGANTDAYQPAERRLRITRGLLQVLREFGHPATLITKSALVERDTDLLEALAADGLVQVVLSFSTLDPELARTLEPRAAAPHRRLVSLKRLSAAGIPCGVLAAPVIPGLTDHELEAILQRARAAGARSAGYVLLRLPLEVRQLFHDWLELHRPERAAKVIGQIRDCRGGRDYDANFATRMQGTGPLARLIADRFRLSERRLGFLPAPELKTGRFRVPGRLSDQLSLF